MRFYCSTMLLHLDLYKHNCFPPADHCHTRPEADLLTEDFWSQAKPSQHVQQCTSGGSLVRSALRPTALMCEESSLAAQRLRRTQHGGRPSASRSTTLQLEFLRKHTCLMFPSCCHPGLVSCCDVIYLVSVSSQFTSIPCENVNQAHTYLSYNSCIQGFYTCAYLYEASCFVGSFTEKMGNNDVHFKSNVFLKYIYLARLCYG